MNGFAAALLAETIILVFIIAVIIHDKIVMRREGKKGQGRVAKLPALPTDLEMTGKALAKLPPMATFGQILTHLQGVWLMQVSGELRTVAMEVFSSEQEANLWLTSRNEYLNGGIPVELCRIPAGEELVLQLLRKKVAYLNDDGGR